MSSIVSNNRTTTIEDEVHDVIMSMAKEKVLGQVQVKEETPSPRGVADIDVSQRDQRKADIEHDAQTFLHEVLKRTVTITEHCRRMTIIPGDVRLALEYFGKTYVEDEDEEDEDQEWDSEMEEVEDETDEREEEEEIDEDDKEENKEAEEEEATRFLSPPVSIGVKEFKERLLWPHMHMLRSDIPITNAAVELFRNSLYCFLVQRFS